MVSLSNRYEAITRAGGLVTGISIDSPQQHSALIDKLELPFSLLSDPDRSLAIEPYGVADLQDARNISRPAIFLVAPNGEVAFSIVSTDYADRSHEESMIDALGQLGLPPTGAEAIEVGPAEPGPNAISLQAMEPYYRGAKFAGVALKKRHPELGDEYQAYIDQMDRYIALTRELRART